MHAMKRGDQVGDFTAVNENGDEIRFGQLLADGPVVLFFYPKAKTPL